MEKGSHHIGVKVGLFILIATLAVAVPYCGAAAQAVLEKQKLESVSPKKTGTDLSVDAVNAVLRIPGYILWSDELSREGRYGFRTEDGTVDRAGARRRVEFRAVQGENAISPTDLIEVYSGELEGAGAAVLFRDDELMTASLDIDGHGTLIEVAATDTGYTVTIIEDIPASDLSVSTITTGRLKDLSIAWPVLHPGSDISVADRPVLPPMVTYYVSSAAQPGGDGTEENPLSSIHEAFERAEDLGAMKVSVVLAFGEYDENLIITRSTELVGDENIPKIRGTIDGAGLGLTIENIEIREAQGIGVRQDGGTLEMTNCRIVSTQRSGDDRSSGRGVVLSGGASALITGCVFRSNEGQALLLTGNGTIATCSDLQANYNQVHPSAVEYDAENNDANGTGCIEVSDGAKLQMEEFDLSGNEYIGVLLLDGSSAHLRYGRIDGTERYDDRGGFNLVVFRECALELQHFVTSNSTCGLHMFHSTLRVIDIELIGNSIGISFQEPPEGYDLGACVYAYEGNIRMQDNAINFDGVALSVPDASSVMGDGDGEGSEAWCPEVLWE